MSDGGPVPVNALRAFRAMYDDDTPEFQGYVEGILRRMSPDDLVGLADILGSLVNLAEREITQRERRSAVPAAT